MELSDKVDKFSLTELSGFARELVATLASGRSAYFLTALTVFSLAGLVFLKSSLVFDVYMIGVALAIMCSIIAISLRGRDSSSCTVQKSLPISVSDEPPPKSCLSNVSEQKPDLARVPELEASEVPNPQPQMVQFTVPPSLPSANVLKVTVPENVENAPVTKDTSPESTMEKKTSTKTAKTFTGQKADLVQVPELQVSEVPNPQPRVVQFIVPPPLLPENVLKATKHVGNAPVTKDTPPKSTLKKKTSQKTVETFTGQKPDLVRVPELQAPEVPNPQPRVVQFIVPPPMLPENVLKATEHAGNTPVTNPESTIDKKVSTKTNKSRILPENVLKLTANVGSKGTAPASTMKKKLFKKNYRTFTGEGVIHFLYHTNMWGRIRLSTPTKWGENQVFFHRDHVSNNKGLRLLHGQHVSVEYIYRAKNKGTVNCLRALRVQFTTPAAKRQMKWTPSSTAREPKNWRSRAKLRRPTGPVRRARPLSPRSATRVAKGPPADGGRGFHFRRTLK